MDPTEKFQKQLLEQTRHIYRETPIAEATEQAYLATPRHRFVSRYREWGTKDWRDVKDDNLAEHVATLYMNRPLILYGDNDDDIPSTISQPSFVLRMLDLLQLKPGHKAFELGTGSGWNAAMMGHLVGPDGCVASVEIIPELAQAAAQSIQSFGIANVRVIAGDGAGCCPDSGPFDRAIFTAGTFDLPRPFFDQIREDGLLLVVIKVAGGGDNLFLLRKSHDHFESLYSIPCGFVQVRGSYQFADLEPRLIEAVIPDWDALQRREIHRRRFWWGGKGRENFMYTTAGIRSFLGVTEPTFRAFKTAKDHDQNRQEHHYFGLRDAENGSLVLAKDDWLLAYGNTRAEDRLLQMVNRWFDLGMPVGACFDLKVFPIDVPLEAADRQWIVRRRDSQFLWSLPA